MTDAAKKGSEKDAREEKILEQGRIEELAEYFDRTDASNPETWGEADDAVIDRPEMEQVSIRLPKEDLEHIRRRAAKSGVGYTTLIRMILRAHLDNPLTH